jgi:hypothetical protein
MPELEFETRKGTFCWIGFCARDNFNHSEAKFGWKPEPNGVALASESPRDPLDNLQACLALQRTTVERLRSRLL